MYKKILYRGRQVGLLRKDGKVFRKVVRDDQIFRKFKGVGISKEVINRIKRAGCKQIRIDMIRNGKVYKHYRVSLDEWIREGTEFIDGDDVRIILPFEKMYSYDVI